MESWTEVRCPACVQLGWDSSRLLWKIYGHMVPMPGVVLQLKCHRCKSVINWHMGTPILVAHVLGIRNHRKARCAFE